MQEAEPTRLTWLQALRLLYAIQQWQHLPDISKDGGSYSPRGYFKKFTPPMWESYLEREIRDTAIRLIKTPYCTACQAPIPPNSTGDHLIPRFAHGPNRPHNYIPLCKRCNSSKNKRDFFDWWQSQNKSLSEVPADVICLYARLMFQQLTPEEKSQPPPDALIHLLREYLLAKPRDFRTAILESTGVITS